ncbi:uncharacterized protein LOC117781913 [Drosophila innubila]|uniref:uncharacterized protein LOC117781913 n=1 Tax=Drosophila innubila TaxID=198719 RepID=UPI00148DE2A9|nr:uncharacterized protein LOC117781913 [Drosophila innubila]
MSEHHPAVTSNQVVVDYGSTARVSPSPSTSRTQRLPSFVLINESPNSQRYTRMRMSHNTLQCESQRTWDRLEYFLNVVNQMCIGFITIYMSYITLRTGLQGTGLHAWLVTIGFSFFMAEGVMVHYGNNVLTNSYKRNTKTTIHWILLTLGGTSGAAGALIKMIQKGFSLHSTHGRLGITAFILCLLSMSSGLGALCSTRVKKLITPLFNKAIHNFLGIACFVISMVTQYYGYETGYFKKRAETDLQILLKCVTLISLVLTSIGPLKAFYNKIKSISK